MKNKFNFTTCYIIHTRALCSQWLFHCAPKPQWEWHQIKFWEGNKCGWWCRANILTPIHIVGFAQTDVCEGIRVTMEKQNINNVDFVKPTLTLQTHKIEFLVSMILPDTTSLQYESIQIHAYSKDVRYMCLLGHVAGTSSHIYGVELA